MAIPSSLRHACESLNKLKFRILYSKDFMQNDAMQVHSSWCFRILKICCQKNEFQPSSTTSGLGQDCFFFDFRPVCTLFLLHQVPDFETVIHVRPQISERVSQIRQSRDCPECLNFLVFGGTSLRHGKLRHILQRVGLQHFLE